MSKQATFDPAKRLDLYFRCNRAGSKDFVFTYSDGSAYSFIYQEFTFNIYRNQGERKVLITLPLVYASNTLTASITKALSNINEGEYYYELYNTDTEETWLCGDANFHNGKFDGVNSDQNSVTVSINGETIAITLEVTPASGSGGGGSSTWGSITGTLSDQTDLQNALNAKANISSLGSAAFDDSSDFDPAGAAAAAQAASQPLDSDLTAIAGLTPSDGDFLYRESGAWVNKTTSQVKALLGVWNTVIPTNDSSNNTTTQADATGYTIPCQVGKRYIIRAIVGYESAVTTTGIILSTSFSGTASHKRRMQVANSQTADVQRYDTNLTSTLTGAATAPIGIAYVTQLIENITVAGNWQLTFASEIAASNVTIKAYGILEYLEI